MSAIYGRRAFGVNNFVLPLSLVDSGKDPYTTEYSAAHVAALTDTTPVPSAPVGGSVQTEPLSDSGVESAIATTSAGITPAQVLFLLALGGVVLFSYYETGEQIAEAVTS